MKDGLGSPIAGASVDAGSIFGGRSSGPAFGTTTDKAGGFSGTLPEGDWQISVGKSGYQGRTESLVVSGGVVRDFVLDTYISGLVSEAGVGPLDGALVEILSGPNSGLQMITRMAGTGNFSFRDGVLPGTHGLRITKAGYDPVQRTVTLPATEFVSIEITWALGTCLASVAPGLISNYSSAGGTVGIAVQMRGDRGWFARPNVPWLTVEQGENRSGSGMVSVRVAPNDAGDEPTRRGAVMIRCGDGGQNVWIDQLPPCQITLEPTAETPRVFPAAGGSGKLTMTVSPVSCRWQTRSDADWLLAVGVSAGTGQPQFPLSFLVRSNSTGQKRSATLFVGEAGWIVTQE